MFYFGALLALSFSSFHLTESLSCVPCGFSPCQEPVCCDSGFYTTDECGCCLTCAKAEDTGCGGPFGISGSCAQGLRCLRSCGCQTKTQKECVFPFKYKGKWYSKCTTDNSDNGAPWCATQVDSTGEVVSNTWEDCEQPCGGFCDDGFLFNVEGRCINSTDADQKLRILQDDNVPAQLDESFSKDQIVAELCPPVRTPADTQEFCRCSKGPVQRDLRGNVKGGCNKPPNGDNFGEESEGYCFLENIQDFANPTSFCYDDTQWSVADGRFYSYIACQTSVQK